ncbi:MAG: HAMP domain-containing sensor histidine kinase [Chloroflexi bacterium]|nr:HAMP domain-containing sensor histidine kinase [Chloroflexota bacterium]
MQAVPWRPVAAGVPLPRVRVPGRELRTGLLSAVALALVAAATGPLTGLAELLSLAAGAGLCAALVPSSIATAAHRGARARTEELRAAAHDLRGPLGTVNTYLELIATGAYGPVSAEAHDALMRASEMTKRAQHVVDSTLHPDRMAALSLTTVDLDEVAREAVAALDATTRARCAVVTVEGALPPVSGDATAVFRVVENLVQNSLKYGDCADGLRVTVRARYARGRVTMEVSDNGRGFSRSARAHAFRLGGRGDTTGEVEGHGLGLATVRRLVLEMHGRVEIPRSKHGAIVRVTLPAA